MFMWNFIRKISSFGEPSGRKSIYHLMEMFRYGGLPLATDGAVCKQRAPLSAETERFNGYRCRGWRTGLLLIAMTALCARAPADTFNDPIDLEADQAVLDTKTRTATYQGNVVLTQGSQRLAGDSLTVHYGEDNKIKSALLLGDPATYEEEKPGADSSRGNADQINYDVEDGIISLQGNATLWFDSAHLSGSVIKYDARHDTIAVDSEDDEKVRVSFSSE